MSAGEKKVLVTGAARGIGAAIATVFQEHGYEVHCPKRNELDLSCFESIDFFVKSGGCDVDILINNAAENIVKPFETLESEEWLRMQAVNLTAPFLLSKAAVPFMVKQGWGRIVNIASCFSVVSKTGRAGYTATKSGLVGLTRAIAVEFADRGVLVNSVSPGFVATDLTRQNNTQVQIEALAQQLPIHRLATPSEIAELVFFIGSEKNTYLTGQNVVVDGGFLCV